jgi:hypothetical protein
MRWEVWSWLARLGLVALAVAQIVTGNPAGGLVAAEGAVLSLLPLLVARLSKVAIPKPMEALFVLGIALQFSSESLKLFELLTYWDKIVHPTLVALTAGLTAWLLLAYRDTFKKHLPIHLVAMTALLLGIAVGAAWEYVEFLSDWFADANLQKSNADTITDLIANDIGAFVATILALRLYSRWLTPAQRGDAGRLARWLTEGPHKVLRSRGGVVGALAAAALAGTLWAAHAIDEGIPALAAGQPGESMTWADLSAPAQALSGDWLRDPRGTCRENLEQPRPGSEKAGLLQIAPSNVYGQDGQPFSLAVPVFEERAPRTAGTQMDGGVAFGIRDKDNYYLLEESALHDVLRLDRVINGRRRDVREELVRTHGDEWHTLQVRVDDSHVEAAIDGQPAFAVDDVPDTAGGIGLWARTAAATCFQAAQVQVG